MNLLISFLQAWGILLVVLGHSFLGAENHPAVHSWIYSFHMPLFMFISGFLLRYGCREQGLSFVQKVCNSGFLLKKVRRLLVPYVSISTLAFVPKVLLSRFAMRPVNFSFDEWQHMLVYPGDNVIVFFWFLPTLFLIFSILCIGGYLHKWRVPLWVCLVAALVLHLFNPLSAVRLLNVSGVVDYLFYFLLGYCVCRYDALHFIAVRTVLYLAVSFVLSILFLVIPDFPGRDVLAAVNGIALSIALGWIYMQTGCRLLDPLFGASFTIYLYSWFPQVLSQQVFLSLTDAPWWVGGILAFVTGVGIPLSIYRWIRNHRDTRIGGIVAYISGV